MLFPVPFSYLKSTRLQVVAVLGLLLLPGLLWAQVEAPQSEFLFETDTQSKQQQFEDTREQILVADKPVRPDLDFSAGEVEYLKGSNKVKGQGGVLVSFEGTQVQANEGIVDLETKDAELRGDVLLTTPIFELRCQEGDLNIESEVGEFRYSDFSLEQGGYQVESEVTRKLTEFTYELEDSAITTCNCDDDSSPWCIKSERTHITEEGYAHAYGASVEAWGIPLLYTPWIAFPVKNERSSGLLAPQYGYSSRDGLYLRLPFYFVTDDYSDVTITPFTETRTRHGSFLNFRRAFSQNHYAEGTFLYSNERPRDGGLRGTVIDGLADPSIDDDRLAAYYSQSWRASPESGLNLGFIADVHYLSDDLIAREIQEDDIAERTARFTTSRAMLRSGLGDYATMELGGEYNQALVADDDFIFQRLPTGSITGSRSFRPFGYNPYGLKVIAGGEIQATDFVRKEGYEGWRYDLYPKLRMPAHYKNYLNTELEVGFRSTFYELSETTDPTTGVELDESQDRHLPTLNYRVSTGVERVFDLPEDSWLTSLTGLGERNRDWRLTRLKHEIVPNLNFNFVPDTTQTDLPLFDSIDRMRERSLFTYGLTTTLWGRFDYRTGAVEDLTELAPRMEDLPEIDTLKPLTDFGGPEAFGTVTAPVRVPRGNIRELARFRVIQSYDYKEDVEDNDPAQRPFSDVGSEIALFPSAYFGFSFDNNYDYQDAEFSSYGIATHVRDDRGDVLRARYTFIDDSISQLEGNLELKVSERVRLAGYGRFDELESEFIERSAAVRLESACNCWNLDLGYVNRINPDQRDILLTFTFVGLGDITQDIGYDQENRN